MGILLQLARMAACARGRALAYMRGQAFGGREARGPKACDLWSGDRRMQLEDRLGGRGADDFADNYRCVNLYHVALWQLAERNELAQLI